MANYINQTFPIKSLKLLNYNAIVKFEKISYKNIPKNCISRIGHDRAAFFINKLLDTDYEEDRSDTLLDDNNVLYIVKVPGFLDMEKHKDISKEKLIPMMHCFKVTAEGFKTEKVDNSEVDKIESNKKIKRLIKSNAYLTHRFSFEFFGKIKNNATIKVNQIPSSEISASMISDTFIPYDRQRKVLEELLEIKINKTNTNWWAAKSGDTFYIATTDANRSQENDKARTTEFYREHSIFLKVEIKGIDEIIITEKSE